AGGGCGGFRAARAGSRCRGSGAASGPRGFQKLCSGEPESTAPRAHRHDQKPKPVQGRPGLSTVWERIEESRSRWNVLTHPFYERWSAGELSREDLARYSGQYRHAVEAIATMSDAAAEAAPERPELAEHAGEEHAHVALWDGFVGAVGGRTDAEPTTETEECVAEWTRDGSLIGSLARLYAIESGQPAISRTKSEGLAQFYGIDG